MTGKTHKTCTQCGQTKPLSEFHNRRDSKDGKRSECKKCNNARSLAWQREHPEVGRKHNRLYRQRNPEKIKAKNKRYRQANREKEAERRRKWREENPELAAEQDRRKAERRKAKRAAQPKPPKPKKPERPKTKRPKRPLKPPAGVEPVKELRQAVDHFLAAKGLKEERTQEWHRNALNLFVNFVLAYDYPQWPPSPDAINAFLADAGKRGCKQATVNNYFRSLRVWLNWLAAPGRDRIDPNILNLIEKVKKPKDLPKAAKKEAILKLLEIIRQAAMDEPANWRHARDRALFVLALDSGARITELATLELADLNLEHNAITIRAEVSKTDAGRTLRLADQTVDILDQWLEVRAALDIPADLKRVFISNHLQAGFRDWTTRAMRKRLATWQDRAGIAPEDCWSFHQWRHSAALFSLRAGAPLDDVQKQLGHTSITTTARYLMCDDEGRGRRHLKANAFTYLAA